MPAMTNKLIVPPMICYLAAACSRESATPTNALMPVQVWPVVKSKTIQLDQEGSLMAWLEVAEIVPSGELLNLTLKIENRSGENIKAYFYGNMSEMFVSSEAFSAPETRPDPENPRFVLTSNIVVDMIKGGEWAPGETVEVQREWSQYVSVPPYDFEQGPVMPGNYWLDGVIRVVAVGTSGNFEPNYSPDGSTTKLFGFEPVMFTITQADIE